MSPIKIFILPLCLFTLFFHDQGITFEEFRSFFQFLNNLEDFAIAMQMYNFACRSIGQGEILLAEKNKILADPVTLNLWDRLTICLSLCLPDEFARAVYVATGLKLTRHLVNTIFKIFDVDHDDQLSYKEFVGIMKDRLHRGGRVREGCRGKSGASS